MFLDQGSDTLINSIDAVANMTNLKTISNVQIPIHCIATISTKQTGKSITTGPCILEMKVDEIITIQNPVLVMLPTVHLKDEVEPGQVLLTQTINLS